MKKILFLSALLTVAFAAQAQLKIAPKMQKGDVKNYTIVATNSIPMQGDTKITSGSKYTVVDATADGYVLDVETLEVQVESDANNVTGKLLAAAEEMQKGVVIRVTTDKDGKPTKVLNLDELRPKMEKAADSAIDKLVADIPQLSQVIPDKSVLKNQFKECFTEETILRGLQESTSPLALNGKTIITGAQEEYTSKDGLKMKRMYFVNGQNIIANSTLNMSKDEMKALLIKQVELRAPEQAQMVKDNIDQILDSGMLKIDMTQKDTYELQADGWPKSIVTENTTDMMGQQVVTKTTITLK
ncbi:MAG: hypothetical protein K6E67_06085 [Prevotella sp.]|jgi:hypothetical protein|nr:hypothetical protein [Prevotella sp.]